MMHNDERYKEGWREVVHTFTIPFHSSPYLIHSLMSIATSNLCSRSSIVIHKLLFVLMGGESGREVNSGCYVDWVVLSYFSLRLSLTRFLLIGMVSMRSLSRLSCVLVVVG